MSEKPPVTWYPADGSNFAGANRGPGDVDLVIIHVTQGSWSGTLSWFQNPASNVSAHYTVRSSDGKIAQSVSDMNVAWHAGNVNDRSIGIEHEGFVDDPAWFTEAMYVASAQLTAFYVTQWGVPMDRNHIIGHSEAPGATHTDPGPNWDWGHYMDLVAGYV